MNNPMSLYYVRSIKEEHAVLDLNPCRCGSVSRPRKHALLKLQEKWVSRFDWNCQDCGAARRFDFVFPDDNSYLALTGYGEANEPSRAIDAAQFLLISDYWARQTPGSTDSYKEATVAARTMGEAIAALEEVLKFIGPDGDESAPPSAFWSAHGKQAYATNAGQYRRDRLEARLRAYRKLLADFQAGAQPQAAPAQPPVDPTVPQPAPAPPPVEPAATPPQAESRSDRMAMWLTLAYIDISFAARKICDLETAHRKKSLAANNLPDPVEQSGTEHVMERYRAGDLQRLSQAFAEFPYDLRKMLVSALTSTVLADGSGDMREIARASTIASWLGIPIG